MIVLNIEKEDCKNLVDLLELYFFQTIRDDETIDNLEWARSVINSIYELKKAAEQ